MNLFKRKKTITNVGRRVLHGEVEFVNKGRIERGVIFGKPMYPLTLIGPRQVTYYIRQGDKVVKIEEEAIEEIH